MSCKDCYEVSPISSPNIELVIPYGNTCSIKYTTKSLTEDLFNFQDGNTFHFGVYQNRNSFKNGDSSILGYSNNDLVFDQEDVGEDSNIYNVIKLYIGENDLNTLSKNVPYYYVFIMTTNLNQKIILMKGSFIID